ncbi:MAG: LruC domain-containing protein [Owenweeksia sp.]
MAYASYYPTSGYQTLAFEDLWPAKGDFDFNDLVVSMDVEMAGDTSNNLVDATFTITADAVGSGLSNGLAIVLRDGSGNFLNDNVISSVTGDATADPDVTNGIIVFSDIYAAQESFYMNNGFGPSAPAEEFTFTVSFNANAGSQIIVPEMYIFRSGERGREIHQKGFSATPAADVTLFNTLDDVNGTYSTANGLPWVIELVTNDKSFQHPLEKVDILQAYPQFQNWAESDGQSASDWYINPDELKVF